MATSAAVPQIPSQSALQRVINTFVAPKNAFGDLREGATWGTWVLPWLLVSVTWIVMVVVGGNKIGFEQIARNKIDMMPNIAEQIDKAPPQQRAETMANQAAQTKIGSYVNPLIILVIWAIIAGIMLGTLVLGFGAKLSFKVALAIVALAALPATIKNLLGALTIALGASPEGFIFENPIASNIGFLTNPAEGLALNTVLSSIDLFSIWTLLLAALGFSLATRKKFFGVAVAVFAWYAVMIGIFAGFVAIFT